MSDLPDDRQVIGRRIAELRIAWGYKRNQTGFAALLGITRSSLSNFEQGLRRPTIDQLGRIRKVTGVSWDWIFHGNDDALRYDLVKKLKEAHEELKKPNGKG